MSRRRWVPWAVLLVTGLGCGPSDRAAVRAVEAYNRRLVEAYRSGDFRLLADVAGPDEFRKVTSLIGVKGDQGLTLDAQLLDFEVQRVERAGAELVVSTRERWYYVDRQIGTGQQVGQDSEDRYEMRYIVGKPGKEWVVLRVEFAVPPIVGRKEVPRGSGRIGHFDLPAQPVQPEPAPGAGAARRP